MADDAPKQIDHEKLMAIKKKLKGLPKMKRVKMYTATEAVDALAEEIKALSRKGYEVQEIVAILEGEGLEASITRVKKALVVPRAEGAAPLPRRNEKANALNQESAARLQEALADEPGEEAEDEADTARGEAEDAPEIPEAESGEPAHQRGRQFLESMLNA